jgi:putative hydrolase of the HAD superfamily
VIEAIVSDFGGVLTTPLIGSFARVQEALGIPVEALGAAMLAVTEREGENPLFALERGEVAEADFLAGLETEMSAALGEPVSLAGFHEHFFGGLEPNTELLARLHRAHEDGIRLALLTNNIREWEPHWKAMVDRLELFEVVIDSSAVGMRKPDPRIYELALERLGLPAQACVLVDDMELNCDAAVALGMHAVRFVDNEQALAELDALLAPS